MLCLVGGQGAGKSTFFRLLAVRDEWFSDDLRKLDDDNVYRKLQGHWIIEMSEMMATANAKSIEEIKSFLSRQKEVYKIPYETHPADRPRQCVFGGTSNALDFLPLDRSGNRRFIPVMVYPEQAEVHILEDEAASRAYIEQMWAEAILLQTQVSGWHPYFTYYFAPGNGYLGGDFFFAKPKPDCITYLETLKTPAHDVVLRHLAVSALIELAGGSVSNCLVHPSVRQASHDLFAREVSKELQWCKDNIDNDFKTEFSAVYDSLAPVKYRKASGEDAYGKAKELLLTDAVKILIMNGKNSIASEQYSTGSNIVIGGNTLGRGVTFPSLHTIYYTRTAKKPQADTMWQHSRMFGYDRDPGLMMVYIDEPLYKLFSDINATNNALIAQVESGTEHIKIYYPSGLKPTRSNVLDERHVAAISGGTNYYPFYPSNNTIEQLDKLLAPFTEDEPVYQVSLRIMKEILSHIESDDDFRATAFISILEMMLSEKPNAQGMLIVRRNRDVAQGTGALLSPNDWALGGQYTASTVLTMYKVTGKKGWGGQELWVPNIKLPNDLIYYDVQEDDSST